MACYFVYGTLGAGKGIFLAKKMKEYLARGSRVATNVDLFPENLCPNTKESISRIPSVFRLEDLDQLGRGCSEDEKVNLGGLFLDEGVFWLNARDWNAKGRKELIQKLVMIRKLGWDIWIAVQDPESVDKQALNALGEHFVCCTRLDHFRIPIVSPIYDFYRLVKSKGREQSTKILPHINRASYRRGKAKQGNKPYFSETYRPKDYFGTYDTNQIFEIDYEDYGLRQVDMRASFSYISGSTLKQWYKPDVQPVASNTKKIPFLSILLFISFLLAAAYSWSIALSDDEPVIQSNQSTQSTSSKVVVPAIPDFLQGVYISGHVMIRRASGQITYDYAMHDRYHRSFDYVYYSLKLVAASPCDAWLETYDGIKYKVSCRLPVVDSSPKSSSVLDDFSLADTATKALNSI
ncbi:hypothetical protein NB559_09915 [Vibrio parahaemolyticus]|uniref:zonular occludens toxin domain-containing protein n=2 Tax=Bacteria TaxID=2 RepID=UPI00215CF6FA|nr:zonular occludens toxin domain-containing protein [Vibrio parahaemolyticus]MCR9650167.1 hypothetical protein [Vibrio parahaemolyticus]